jgi:hypothetical protein
MTTEAEAEILTRTGHGHGRSDAPILAAGGGVR